MKLTSNKLKQIINEVLNESEYYANKGQGDDFNSSKIALAGPLEPEGSRDRFDQIEKYLQLISKREMQKFASKTIIESLIDILQFKDSKDSLKNLGGLGIKEATKRFQNFVENQNLEDSMKKQKIDVKHLSFNGLIKEILKIPKDNIKSIDGSQASLDNWLDNLRATILEAIGEPENEKATLDLYSMMPRVPVGKPFSIFKQLGFKVNDPYPVKSNSGFKTEHRVKLANAEEEIKDFYRAGVEHLVAQGTIANLEPKDREMVRSFGTD